MAITQRQINHERDIATLVDTRRTRRNMRTHTDSLIFTPAGQWHNWITRPGRSAAARLCHHCAWQRSYREGPGSPDAIPYAPYGAGECVTHTRLQYLAAQARIIFRHAPVLGSPVPLNGAYDRRVPLAEDAGQISAFLHPLWAERRPGPRRLNGQCAGGRHG